MLYRVLMWLSVVWSINDRDRVNFDQVAGGQRRNAEHHVRWLVISEQRFPGLFNNRQAFVAFVIDDVDCDPGDLRRPRTGSSKCSAEIAKHLVRLSRKITRANELAMYVFGLLARDEYHLASRRNDDLGVRLRSRQILGIDAFERHRLGLLLWLNSNVSEMPDRDAGQTKQPPMNGNKGVNGVYFVLSHIARSPIYRATA